MPGVSRRFLLGTLPLVAAAACQAQFKRAEDAQTAKDASGATPAAKEADATFRMDVSVVNVFATVRDPSGRIVGNLTKDDFELLDNGKPREIQYFTRQSDLPLTIGLLIDTSFSQRGVLDEEREASRRFLDEVLRPEQDQAFLIKFDSEVELVQDLTPSKALLEKGLAALRTPQPQLERRYQAPGASPFQIGVGIPFPGGRSRRMPGGRRGGGNTGGSPGGSGRGIPAGIGTALYDAVFLAGDEVLGKQTGRKAMLILSDGVDFGSKVSQAAAIEAAQRAETQVYSILYADKDAPGQGRGGRLAGRLPDGKKVLSALSTPSGGKLFEVSKKMTLSAIYTQVQEELRNQYSFGFAPEMGSGPAFRKLEIRARDKKLTVQARDGYYPKPG